jgi:hypothetical protein
MKKVIKMEIRNHNIGGEALTEHKHENYDYWHPITRVHADEPRDRLPPGHVLNKKPLYEKLILDKVEVTPIQMMGVGASLEIGAVQSLMEGLEHRRYAASSTITFEKGGYGLFYAEWQPNHASITHRYLIQVSGEDVYVGYFPYDGRKPILYGIHHKKMDVVKFLHKTHSADLQVPELTLLTELNVPNVSFESYFADSNLPAHLILQTEGDRERYPQNATLIRHKQGSFYTRSIYGEFSPLQNCKFTPDGVTETSGGWNDEEVDSTGYNMGNPKHLYYMFQGATGYVQLYEGKMFCYPDGSIRFLTKEQEEDIFRSYTDLQIVQGDLVAYELEGHTVPEPVPTGVCQYNIDRHHITTEAAYYLLQNNLGRLYIEKDCILTITHPEHGETKYEALKGEMLALLPGTSRPFQKDEGRD